MKFSKYFFRFICSSLVCFGLLISLSSANIQDAKKRIVFFGDSITAGYGLSPDQAFPALIQQKLDSNDMAYEVINAGLSGETSAGGLGRIDWILRSKPDIFILELGGNDGLRGLSLAETEKNLAEMVKRVRAKNPDDVVAEISLAESYALQDNLSKSLTSYQGLIEKFQRMPILLNNAANIALRLGDKGLAAEYANEAYKKAPNNPSIIDTFAWINTQLGKRSEAISLFRQALVLDFDNAEVKYHLAVTLKAEQRDREAYKLLTEAVKAEQEFSDKALAKELLKQWRLEN